MIDQDTIGTVLVARLAVWVTAAQIITTDVLTETPGAVILTVLPGGTERTRLTARGFTSRFLFDCLLYFKGTTEDMSDDALRTAMALAESQLAAFVAAEGGNQNGYNSVDYDSRATNQQIELMAQQLDALRLISLAVTVF